MLLLLSLYTNLLTGDALKPFEPPQGTQISSELRTAPDLGALILRKVQPTDKWQYLRSQADWYEIELTSTEGFVFRGWVKGALPQERAPPPPLKVEAPKPKFNPLDSKNSTWFWSGQMSEKFFLSVGLGLQTINYTLEGTYSSGTRSTIYSFSAPGFAINANAHIPLLEWKAFQKKTSWVLNFQYTYGISSVSFPSDFVVPEIQGASYAVSTHLYDLKTLLSYDLVENGDFHFQPAMGVGYLLYEILPDLRAVQGGAYDGELIVGDTTFSGVGIPIQLNFKAWKKFGAALTATPYFLLPDISEDVLNNPPYEQSGLPPMIVELSMGYELAPSWQLLLDGRYLKFEGSSSGAGTRLKNPYTNGTISVVSYQIFGGFKYTF